MARNDGSAGETAALAVATVGTVLLLAEGTGLDPGVADGFPSRQAQPRSSIPSATATTHGLISFLIVL